MKSVNLAGWLKRIGLFTLAVVTLLYLVLPASIGIVALLPGRAAVGPPPQGYAAVTLQTADGVALQAWYRPGVNGKAIILTHGAGASRESLRPYAELLGGRGYGVLAVDLRGHGTSEGNTNRLGWQGTRDIGAAVDFLAQRSEVQFIGGLGISMGAEALLGAASSYPALRAIVADGATRRSTEELLALASERPLVRNFTAQVMYATVQLFSGEAPPHPLLDSMLAADATQFLLIAGGSNQLEVAFNERFAAALGGRAALWIAPETEHTGALARYPDEYEQRVTEFFDSAFFGLARR
jgi:pimeloyl-ACP methyl ester carboxylesterase